MNTELGYKQPGNRYFWRKGAQTNYTVGFKSKKQAIDWIDANRGLIEWAAGFTVKFRVFDTFSELIDRKGNEIKPR